MFTGKICRFICAVVIILGCLAGNSLSADNTKTLNLSKTLSQVKLFAGLTNTERDALKNVATLRQGKEGERIIQQGKTSGKMFIILEGDAEVRIDGKSASTGLCDHA